MKHTNVAKMPQGHSFIREGNVIFTPAQANMVLANHKYEKNRDITRSPAHIATMAELMRRGLWLPRDQIAFGRIGPQLVLLNGHHRMSAQVKACVNIEWNVVIYECKTKEGLAKLYTRFDTNSKKRSDTNVMDALGIRGDSGLLHLAARGLWTALPLIANGLADVRNSTEKFYKGIADDRMTLAAEYMQEAIEYQEAIDGALSPTKSKLFGGGVMAVGLVVMKSHGGAAREFFKGIAEDDGLRRGDPRKAFLTWLLDAVHRGTSAPRIYATAYAWNAFMEGKTVPYIRLPGTPITVHGTDFVVSL